MWRFLLIVLWMIVMVVVFLAVGCNVFGGRGATKQVVIGAFAGSLFFFSGLAFLVGILYSFALVSARTVAMWIDRYFSRCSNTDLLNVSSSHTGKTREGRAAGETMGYMLFSILCLCLAPIYGSFAIGLLCRRQELIRANAKDRCSFHMPWKSSKREDL
jgi:hypothetical protein